MLEYKRGGKNVKKKKKNTFSNIWHVSFCFYVIWTAILSSCVSRPFYYKKKKNQEGGH